MNSLNMHNHTFYQVDVYKKALYGSESPARYGRDPGEFISLYKRNNITHVISLDNQGLENIEISCKEHGIDHQSSLIEDFKIYKKSYDGYFLPLLKEVQKIMLDPKNKIVFHCRAGHGRTGTVLSALKIFEIVNFTRKKEDLKLLVDKIHSGELLKNHKILPSKENAPCQVSEIVQEAINIIRTSKNGGSKGAVESSKDIETLNLWAYRIIYTKLNE
jgi:hypothetical protein